jgi:hypothetical protein
LKGGICDQVEMSSDTSISFTWKFLEPVKKVGPSVPVSPVQPEPKLEVFLSTFALQLSEILLPDKCGPIQKCKANASFVPDST